MVRTQIQLTEQQAAALKSLAAERGVSMAALIRDAVEVVVAEGTDRERRRQRALAVVGKFRDARTDVAAGHDRYLEDAYLDWRR
jgi:ribbon-helix-helix CopG family protein